MLFFYTYANSKGGINRKMLTKTNISFRVNDVWGTTFNRIIMLLWKSHWVFHKKTNITRYAWKKINKKKQICNKLTKF